jgi:hypothetical protein
MNDTFLSYASVEYDKARILGEYLQSEGFQVWMDKKDIMGQSGWRAVITSAIEESKSLIVIISKNSVISEDVETEVVLAADQKIPILFIYFEDAELSQTLKYVSAGKQFLRFIEKEKIKDALLAVVSETKATTLKHSSFPFSVTEQIGILGIRPKFILGNGKHSSYIHNSELLLFNKGKEARNVAVSVQEGATESITCVFYVGSVRENEAIRVPFQTPHTGIRGNATVKSLKLSYEDSIGTPYSEGIDEMIARENRGG